MFKLSTFLGHIFLQVCGSRLFHDKGAQYRLHQRHYCRDLRKTIRSIYGYGTLPDSHLRHKPQMARRLL